MPLPEGTITCLFTDVEGSTHLSKRLRQKDNARLVERQRERLRGLFTQFNGGEVDTQGDAFFVTFQHSHDALACAAAIQRSLRDEPICETDQDDPTKQHQVSVRIGIYRAKRDVLLHSEGSYIDREINLASRIIKGGVGGQILVSDLARRKADNAHEFRWECWPDRRLKDFDAPEDVYELLWDGKSRGEPGARWLPNWYRGERNAYIPRAEKEKEVLAHFATKPSESSTKVSDSSPVRLVTLKGFGGMGKTRLGIACALQCVGLFNGCVYFVKLEDCVGSPEAVGEAIGAALGMKGEQCLPSNLIPALRDTDALLLLDNYENVHCPEVQKFLRDLLHQTNHLRLLLTGREKVNLGSLEQLVEVERLTQPEARDLFIARAQLVLPGWQPALPEEHAALAAILRDTECIPLAVELVAAGMGDDVYGSVELVAQSLADTPLPAFPDGYMPADPSVRHESLTRCLDWSYNLLAPTTQEDFARLGLFADTITPQTAQTAAGILNSDKLLMRLAQASLLKRVGEKTERRYTFLRPTRAYAHDQLLQKFPKEERYRMEQEHAKYFLDLAEEATKHLKGADQKVDQLENEVENLNAALKWCAANNVLLGMSVATELWRFWWMRGYGRMGLERLEDLLNKADGSLKSTAQWAEAAAVAGHLARHLGDHKRAEQLHAQSLAAFGNLGNPSGAGRVLRQMGVLAWHQGRGEDARFFLKESLVKSQEGGKPEEIADAYYELGNLARFEGKHEEALKHLNDSLDCFRETSDKKKTATALLALGNVATRLQRVDEARSFYAESLQLFDALKDKGRLTLIFERIAAFAALRGRSGQAAVLIGAAEQLRKEIGSPLPEPDREEYYARLEADLKQNLNTDYETEREKGQTMSLKNAVSAACEEVKPEESSAKAGD